MSRRNLYIPGLLFIAVTIIVAFAAINSQRNLLFWIFGVMSSAIVMSAIVSHWTMVRLDVRRLGASHGTVDDALVVRYAITNRSRFMPAFSIRVDERPPDGDPTWRGLLRPAQAWVMHIGPRETIHGEAVFWPLRRGAVAFEAVRLSTTFPFGVLRKTMTVVQPQQTLIHPKLHALRRRVLKAIVPDGPPGMKIAAHAGANDDYFGLREYRIGDSLRHIAWKRLARSDDLVSIERSRPNPPRIRVVLNLIEPTDALRIDPETENARDLEETAISLAASIIHAADEAGYEVGLTVHGVDVPLIPIRRNHWHRGRMLAALAGIDLDAPRLPRGPSARDERAGVVVVHPDRVVDLAGGASALHLRARQMSTLTDGPLGWTARRRHDTTAVSEVGS
ncbi:MAG: DUF58 domain-containing protein [Phycisphaerales bacterium]|nr:DUF58 domain-containing protein [Phycisphaerales bacterium]